MTYTLEQIRSALAKPAPATHTPGTHAAPTPPTTTTTTTDAPADAPAAPLGIAEVRLRLSHLKQPRTHKLIKRILDGKPFAKPGERDVVLQSAASTVAFVAPDDPPHELALIFAPSLDEMSADTPDGCLTLEDVAEKISRAQQDAHVKRAARAVENARCAEAMIRSARRSAGEASVSPSATHSGEPYSDEELREIAARVGARDLEELQRRWIIQKGPAFYILVGGRYKTPISKDELPVALPHDLAPAPIAWTAYTQKGTERKRTVAELLGDYCTVAREAVAHLDLAESWFDAEHERFHEAVCPLRVTDARYHPLIDQWLQLLPEDSADLPQLLDWIATATDLSRPTCALYLSGAKSAGKSMLALGMARLWSEAPTDLGRALADFNADLARCPLVFADEHMPEKYNGKHTSAELRALIAATARTLNRKYLPNYTLQGAVRLVLAANNDRLLWLGDEDVSQEDLRAFSDRFLHIRVSKKAALYLATSVGGRRGTADWVTGEAIARHALWLRDTRLVTPGSRFLVEGRPGGELAKTIALQSNIASSCAEWVARHLADPKSFARASIIGSGRILVNAGAVAEGWRIHVRSGYSPPSTNAIGRAMANLSRGVIRVGTRRFHDVNPELVYSWARLNQVGDVDDLKKRVAQPLPSQTEAALAVEILKA